MKKVLSAIAISVVLPVAANAAEFGEVDANADGLVSMEEARAAMPDLDEATFAAADQDGDGSLNSDEFTQLQG